MSLRLPPLAPRRKPPSRRQAEKPEKPCRRQTQWHHHEGGIGEDKAGRKRRAEAEARGRPRARGPALTLVTSTQLRTQCKHILSISVVLGCRMISGAVRMVSTWNRGTLPRISALKDCRFLGAARAR